MILWGTFSLSSAARTVSSGTTLFPSGICPLQGRQVVRAQQMEHEEIVSLAHQLRGNRSGLLGNEDTPESVLATLLRPFHKNRLPFFAVRREDCLRLLDNRHHVQELSLG